MKHFFTLILFTLFFATFSYAQRSSCPGSPYPSEITQPDGSTLTVILRGSEMLHYKETTEGYTILKNASGIYEYAVIDNRGFLTLSGIKAVNQIAQSTLGKNAPQKHLRFNQYQEQTIKDDFIAMNAEAYEMGKGAPKVSYPTLGNIKILALCIQFPDEPAIYPISAITDMMNQSGYNTYGSFRDYFIQNSYGKCTPTVDVVGWYTATRNREQYGKTLNNGTDNPSYTSRVRELVRQALDSADIKTGVDFTKYDNDNDGDVDGVIVFHSGYGAEQNLDGYIWSHRSSFTSVTKDGKTIRDYCINPTKRNWSGNTGMVGLGVLTHEFGHIMGLPDLYDTDQSSEGIGEWGLMGACGWLNQEKTPCMLEAWSKVQYGWVDETMLIQPGDYKMKASIDTAICYRINTSRTNEYFLLEYRRKKGWDNFLKTGGLAIWHINTTKTSLYPGNNSVNADTAMFGVGLIQADGQRHLEMNSNRSDAGDLYPGTSLNTSFTPTSKPASDLHYQVGGVAQPSNITISSIVLNPLDSSLSFRFGAKATSWFSVPNNTGCAPYKVTFTNESVAATSFNWNFGTGATSTSVSPEYTYTTPGTYTVTLVIMDSNSVVADSVSQIITVLESPKASYTGIRDSVNGNVINFTNTSTGATYYAWRFGTNQSSSAESLKYTLTSPGFLEYYLVAYNSFGCSDTARGVVDFWPTGITDGVSQIGNIFAYPNPTGKSATLNFTLRYTTNMQVEVFNLLGEKTGELMSGELSAGTHAVALSEIMIPTAGMYLIKLKAGQETAFIKLLKQ